jgi:hypothetical protein
MSCYSLLQIAADQGESCRSIARAGRAGRAGAMSAGGWRAEQSRAAVQDDGRGMGAGAEKVGAPRAESTGIYHTLTRPET